MKNTIVSAQLWTDIGLVIRSLNKSCQKVTLRTFPAKAILSILSKDCCEINQLADLRRQAIMVYKCHVIDETQNESSLKHL